MFKLARPLFLICETPLHVGSGDSLGIIDMPIQRERHTGFPKVESSSLKGSLRTAFEGTAGNEVDKWIQIQAAFGYDEDGIISGVEEKFTVGEGTEKKLKKEFIGCLGFTDARILLFPVKSMKGVFAWITCPLVLKKFAEEMRLCERSDLNFFQDISENTVPNSCELVVNKKGEDWIVLEEFAFKVSQNQNCVELATCLAEILFAETPQSYWEDKLSKSFVVLSNDDFKDFVEHSTEVITRTKIDNDTGTVQDGALFTEEFLPTDSIMYSLVLASPIPPMFWDENKFAWLKEFKKESHAVKYFEKSLKEIGNIFQLGGNATLGKGIVRMVFLNDIQTGEDKA